MKYVYLLKSIKDPTKKYIGLTDDVEKRLNEHNHGKSKYTQNHMPWKLITCISFSDEEKAVDFEQYLKTGSGWAFAKKRLWD